MLVALTRARCIFVYENNLAALTVGTAAAELAAVWNIFKSVRMPRKKISNPKELLTQPIIIRVKEETYRKLEKLVKESDCGSVGEVARKILTGKMINCFYRDVSLHGPVEELARIRKELKAIGININQQTRYFSASIYKTVDNKVDRLLAITSQLADKWLQK